MLWSQVCVEVGKLAVSTEPRYQVIRTKVPEKMAEVGSMWQPCVVMAGWIQIW